MKKTLILSLSITVLMAGFFIASCNKMNMATELGQGLIPEVDNIHTFDTTLEVHTYNGIFSAANDTFRSQTSFPQLLGIISNDPVFGKTNAKMYFQVSQGNTKMPFKATADKIILDSVVLILDHLFTYGDTMAAQTLQVSEISQSNDFKYDSLFAGYPLSKTLTTTTVLGSKTFVPNSLKDSIRVVNYPDTAMVAHQLRIKLDNSFGTRLLAYDTTSNDGYSSDSAFRSKFKGFAVESVSGGNALLGFSVGNSSTSVSPARLAVYYRYQNGTSANDMDTTVFTFSYGSSNQNILANNVVRDYNGTQVATGIGDDVEDAVIYMQNNPGTYATVKIPGLSGFPNGVIHMAELQMESVYDVSDSLFKAPNNVFLDILDTTDSKHKLIPYLFDATASTTGTVLTNYPSFYNTVNPGQTYYYKRDASGNLVKQWRFNLTRYLQHIVSKQTPAFNFRLYAPAGVNLPLGESSPVTTSLFPIPYPLENGLNLYGLAGVGRVRIGGGNHPTQKMKLRIIYSKP